MSEVCSFKLYSLASTHYAAPAIEARKTSEISREKTKKVPILKLSSRGRR